jgi:hypothetical protein
LAKATFIFDHGTKAYSCLTILTFRIRVNISAMGSVVIPPHQLDFLTPAISPFRANSRKQMRQIPNFRM